MKQDNFPIAVVIQTTSYCNGYCIICPYRVIYKELPQGNMDWDLYRKIIDECSNYKVRLLQFFLFDEPLLDKDITEHLRYAKEKLPQTKTVISTNASLLKEELTHQLLKYVDIFIFNVLGITKEEYERMMPGLNFENTLRNIIYFINYKKAKGFKNIAFVRQTLSRDFLIKKGALKEIKKIYNFWRSKGINWTFNLFFSRAGNIDEGYFSYKKINKKRLSGCWLGDLPLKWIHILFNGDVVLCCMDYKREVILGNVKEKSIYEVWNGDLYNKIRDRIYLNKYNNKDDNFICTRCENPYIDINI